jgi:hypothetical protein
MKKIGIMQPYFLPYIGYFQLINYVDEFVIYDNVQFSKKGWIHRNRMLQNGKDEYFSLPLRKDSDFLDINQRFLADSFEEDKIKILNRIINNYRNAPKYESIFPVVENIFNFKSNSLFDFVFNSVTEINYLLGIKTPVLISSSIDINHNLKSSEKVQSIIIEREGTDYINPIGGVSLYSKDVFNNKNIKLSFIKANDIIYKQFQNTFVPNLSILDVLMFNNLEEIQILMNDFIIE